MDAAQLARASKEPTKQVIRKHEVLRILIELSPLMMVIFSSVFLLFLIQISGVNPLDALSVMLDGSVGSKNSLAVTVTKATPLIISGLAVTVAARCGLWNIGAEGQIYFGGLFVAVILLRVVPHWPGVLQIMLGITAAFVGGALWMLIPALLRAYRGTAELVTTLLLNFVAVNVITIMVQGPLGDANASFPRSPTIPTSSFLPILLPGTQMHMGILIAMLLAVLIYVLIWKTFLGLELRAVGQGFIAAITTGIRVRRRILMAMLLSGGLAGIAGGVEVLGLHHRLSQGFSPGYGYDAITVALLGGTHPVGVIPAALFLGALRAGAPAMERNLGIPIDLVDIAEGLALISLITGFGLRAILRRRYSSLGYGI